MSDNSFIAQIKAGFGEGLKSVGSELLPVWAKQQALDRQEDKLASPTFDVAAAPPRIETVNSDSGRAVTNSQGGSTLSPTLFLGFGLTALIVIAMIARK